MFVTSACCPAQATMVGNFWLGVKRNMHADTRLCSVGHVFWDCATWMYPSILMLHPDIANSILQYRCVSCGVSLTSAGPRMSLQVQPTGRRARESEELHRHELHRHHVSVGVCFHRGRDVSVMGGHRSRVENLLNVCFQSKYLNTRRPL